jgi:hypothetical protein
MVEIEYRPEILGRKKTSGNWHVPPSELEVFAKIFFF